MAGVSLFLKGERPMGLLKKLFRAVFGPSGSESKPVTSRTVPISSRMCLGGGEPVVLYRMHPFSLQAVVSIQVVNSTSEPLWVDIYISNKNWPDQEDLVDTVYLEERGSAFERTTQLLVKRESVWISSTGRGAVARVCGLEDIEVV